MLTTQAQKQYKQIGLFIVNYRGTASMLEVLKVILSHFLKNFIKSFKKFSRKKIPLFKDFSKVFNKKNALREFALWRVIFTYDLGCPWKKVRLLERL